MNSFELKIAIFTTFCVVTCAALANGSWAPKSFHQAPAQVGEKAPDFKIKNLCGEIIGLESVLAKGKPLVIFTFANECPNLPRGKDAKFPENIEQFYQLYKDDVSFMLVDVDFGHWQSPKYPERLPPKSSEQKFSETGQWCRDQQLLVPKENVFVDTEAYCFGKAYNGGPKIDSVTDFDPDQPGIDDVGTWGAQYIISADGIILFKKAGKFDRPYNEMMKVLEEKCRIPNKGISLSGHYEQNKKR